MHRYLPPGVEEGTPCHDILDQPLSVDGPGVAGEGDAIDTSPYEKFDPLLHIGVGSNTASRQTRSSKPKKKEILSIAFVKKYIQYAKSKPAPALTKGAADHIVQVYASLRNQDMEGNNKKVIYFCHLEFSSLTFSLGLPDITIDGSHARNPHSSRHGAC